MNQTDLEATMTSGSCPARSNPPGAAPAADVPVLKLFAIGLKSTERLLLDGTVRVWQRRTPRLDLLPDAHAADADVVMVDAGDAQAVAWARRQPWLADKAVIWIDGASVPPGHTITRRPVQWPTLPILLVRALENGPGAHAATGPGTLPAALDDAAPTAAHTILIVDDSMAVRAHLRSMLEARRFGVSEAVSVDAALELLDRQEIDCVLMDVLMPGLDGHEGCRRIKARPGRARSLPVVMLTSRSSPFDRVRGKMAGCDAYLTKPVDARELEQVLQQHLRRASSRSAAAAGRPTSLPPGRLRDGLGAR